MQKNTLSFLGLLFAMVLLHIALGYYNVVTKKAIFSLYACQSAPHCVAVSHRVDSPYCTCRILLFSADCKNLYRLFFAP